MRAAFRRGAHSSKARSCSKKLISSSTRQPSVQRLVEQAVLRAVPPAELHKRKLYRSLCCVQPTCTQRASGWQYLLLLRKHFARRPFLGKTLVFLSGSTYEYFDGRRFYCTICKAKEQVRGPPPRRSGAELASAASAGLYAGGPTEWNDDGSPGEWPQAERSYCSADWPRASGEAGIGPG